MLNFSIYTGTISYDFSNLASSPQQNSSNAVWVGHKESLVDLKDKKQQDIIKALATNLNPFSCINPIYGLVIIDKKTFLKSKDNSFEFKNKELSQYEKQHSNQSLLTKRLDIFLKENWFKCKQNFEYLFKNKKHLGGLTEEQNQKLLQFLQKSQKITLLMIGKDPTYNRQAPSYFALQFDQQGKDSLKNDTIKYGDNYLLSKYIIFSKTQPLSLLSFSISFQEKRKDNAHQSVFKNNHGVYTRNKMYCEVTIEDRHDYFKSVIQNHHNFEKDALLSRFRFETYKNIIEYPYKEPIMKRRRYIPEASYSLAFQGGGAKGAAYVGAYKAIKQMKKNIKDAKPIPITSIIGSSAGGMISLAISTGIDPHQVEKICYKMSVIPETDRFQWTDMKSDTQQPLSFNQVIKRQKGILSIVKEILNEYGIINKELIDKLIEFYNDKLAQKFLNVQTYLSQFLLAFMPSIGQILDFKQGEFTKFNMTGLLLEGALMKGEALPNIGADCLVKYLLSDYQKYSKVQNFPNTFTLDFSKEISQSLKDFHQKYMNILKMKISQIGTKQLNRVSISIINKIILLIARIDPQSFFITQSFVQSLSYWFIFTGPINNLSQFIGKHKKISESKQKINKIEQNQKIKMKESIEQRIDIKKGINYRILSQIINQDYLLNPIHFIPKAKSFQQATIIQFIQSLFPQYIKTINNQDKYIQEIAEGIVDTFKEEKIVNNPHFHFNQIDEYITKYELLKTAVKKITLQQYYKLTKIEFTCTSVDLDDKILRFFNHKTTPDLPVCRAVQMTGSFPVGFKAQHWKPQWGKYLVHYQNVRRQVDIENHQFTDGGVLANFPIKYFDNDTIRDTYFSHMTCKDEKDNKTILLGFGLDQLDPNSYSPSQKEIIQKFNETTQIQRARVNLNQSLAKLKSFDFWEKAGIAVKQLIPLWKSLKKAQRDTIPWKAINHALLDRVPVMRLLIKLLQSYPHADRNLNLECFQNSIFITGLPAIERTFSEKIEEETLDVRQQIKKLNNLQKTFSPSGSQVNIEKVINAQIDTATMNKNILKISYTVFKNFRERCWAEQNKMSEDQKLQKQKIIKQKLLDIIYYKMKLKPKSQIQTETLKFMELKYVDFSEKDLSLKISEKKIEAECDDKDYHKIQSQLPFKDFNDKMYKAQVQGNTTAKKIQIDKVKGYLQDEVTGSFLWKNTKSKYEDRVDFISLPTYYLTNNLKYLVQYIFLSKINMQKTGNHEELMERANDIANRTSHHDLLLNYDLKKKTSYITIRDLKNFYRKIFNKQNLAITRVDIQTLKSEQQLISSEKEDFYNIDASFYNVVKKDKFEQATSINEDISPNIMQNEGYLFLRTILHQIQYAFIVSEAFSNSQNRRTIQSQLSQQTHAKGQDCAKILSKKLGLKQAISAKDLDRLMANPKTTLKILDILYTTEYEDYSQNQNINRVLQAKYKDYSLSKMRQLDQVRKQIDFKMRHNSLSKDTNPLQLKINYLIEVELTLVYLLLKKTLQEDKQLGFNLEQTKIGSVVWPDSDHDKYRKQLRDEMIEQNKQRGAYDDKMIDLIRSYQRDFQIFMIYIIQIQQALYDFTKGHNKQLTGVKILSEYSDTISKCMSEIKDFLIHRLNVLINLPSQEITIEKINNAYTLKYNSFRQICEALFKSIKFIIDEVTPNNKQKLIFNLKNQDIAFLQQFVLASFKYLDQYKFSLPNFKIYWDFYQREFRYGQYSREMNECLAYQLSNSFIQKWNNSRTEQEKIKEDNKQKIKEIKLHVILQGLDMANVYYPYFYEIFSKFKLKDHKEQQETPSLHNIKTCLNRIQIRAITTSSYHSIFGFLIALKYRDQQIKNEMVAIRQIALTFENKKMVQKNFENYQWIRCSPQDYKQFWNYILQQQINFFTEMEKLANKRAQSHNIQNQFGKIKDMYINEEQSIHNSCKIMIDEMAQSMSKIDNETEAKNKTIQIAKTYGINYTCSLKQEHQYETKNTQNFSIYEKIIKKMFQFYGTLFEGFITNVITAQGRINLNKSKSAQIYKGIFMKQLLSVFKIRSYVIDKLKKKKIKENITLLQFFNEAPKKILLNFTTINIDDSRLHFMNKNTMPNIPLWAAIVASASHPYFYRSFESSNDWESPVFDKVSLFQRIVNDFFTIKTSENNHVKYTSGNMISSLPMELLTNERIISQMFTFQKKQKTNEEPYLYLGFAFNGNSASYKNPTFMVERNYLLNYGGWEAIWDAKKIYGKQTVEPNCPQKNSKHQTTNFDQTSGVMEKITRLLGTGQSLRTIGIFTESNDNFIFHSYSDKLVKLPIKLGTLDFHYIVDKQMKDDYGVTLPNHRVKQTIEQSYEITQYFSREYFVAEQKSTFNEDKFKMNVRVSIIVQQSNIKGVKIYFAKIELLSHSKWNKNKFNNFVVDYSVDDKNFSKTVQRAQNSQLLWKLNQSSKIYLRFYFPHHGVWESLVNYTQIVIDVSNLINQLPLTNSYDYTFSFYDCMANTQGQRLLVPFRKNQYDILHNDYIIHPKLQLSQWNTDEMDEDSTFYIQPLKIRQ